MEIQKNISLKDYSTMRLGGPASYLAIAESQEQLIEAAKSAKSSNIPIVVIGHGSNIIWRDEGFPGLVIVNRIKGFEVVSDSEFGTYVSVGSGEVWDTVVERCVKLGLSGIECLSMIPGTAGATPVQNVGAYGQELSQTLATVTAFDLESLNMVTIPASDCNFSYRDSIFKSSSKGRYLITSITLMLSRNKPMPPYYSAVANYLEQHKITDASADTLRQAVMTIRKEKLPDPKVTPNCGSFFANPIVDNSLLLALEDRYPSVPNWPAENNQVKIPAAWLIEQAGFKDYFDQESGVATWPIQPLILVNRSGDSTTKLLAFADEIKAKVKHQFSIDLVMEPQILPS